MSARWPDVCRLVIQPRRVAEVAVATSPLEACAAFGLGGGAVMTLVLLPLMMAVGEPFRTVGEYFGQVLKPGFILNFFMWLSVLMAAGAMCGFAFVRSKLSAPRARAEFVSILLLPLPLILPAAIWSGFGAIALLSDPSLSIIGPVPSWMFSPLIRALGSYWALLVSTGSVAVLVYWAAERQIAARFPPAGVCRVCGYDLAGLPSGLCPECGHAATGVSPPDVAAELNSHEEGRGPTPPTAP